MAFLIQNKSSQYLLSDTKNGHYSSKVLAPQTQAKNKQTDKTHKKNAIPFTASRYADITHITFD